MLDLADFVRATVHIMPCTPTFASSMFLPSHQSYELRFSHICDGGKSNPGKSCIKGEVVKFNTD